MVGRKGRNMKGTKRKEEKIKEEKDGLRRKEEIKEGELEKDWKVEWSER